MKTTVECRNWSEYESLNGTTMFCSAAAYGKTLTAAEASSCGCTELKREKCMKAMVNSMGYGLLPKIGIETPVREKVNTYEPLFEAASV